MREVAGIEVEQAEQVVAEWIVGRELHHVAREREAGRRIEPVARGSHLHAGAHVIRMGLDLLQKLLDPAFEIFRGEQEASVGVVQLTLGNAGASCTSAAYSRLAAANSLAM